MARYRPTLHSFSLLLCLMRTRSIKGGKPPITATLFPVSLHSCSETHMLTVTIPSKPGGSQRNTTLQSSTPSGTNPNDPQSFKVFVPYKKGQTFLVALSDATGFATGGASNLLTVGTSQSGNNCNTTDPGVDFYFQLDSPLNQCQ